MKILNVCVEQSGLCFPPHVSCYVLSQLRCAVLPFRFSVLVELRLTPMRQRPKYEEIHVKQT